MKRRTCLIECLETVKDPFFTGIEKRIKENVYITENINMIYKNTAWYKSLLNAEKSCIKDNKIKKIHYKFEDGREMVEEYNIDTQVLLRRSWKLKGKLGGEGKWQAEIGDPIPEVSANVEVADLTECKDQPILTRRNTRVNLEWRIRNLPYPIETYSIKVDNDNKCIIVSTTNKKYYKKLEVPELQRLNLQLQQANVQSSHNFNTLIISYKKPQPLLDMEKEWFEQLKTVKPIKDIPNECNTQ
ncbi:protein DPCD isoform X1 [Papilio machaon]|uniref:protein DPCD isoform X1 n=2 Tax=Papilio machaon TaxID=76193 RepID=UPI001E663C1E|nr:protein DPCD isoform X1 [Papilio machaon]